MRPGVSAGSNQVGAKVTCTPQRSSPCGPPARATVAPSISANARIDAHQKRRAILKPRCLMSGLLLTRQCEIFVGSRIREAGNQAEPGFLDARTVAVEEGELPQMRDDRPLVHELLDLVQHRLALRVVEFGRLLREQGVDIGIAAVGIDAALRDEGLDPGGRVAEGAAATRIEAF